MGEFMYRANITLCERDGSSSVWLEGALCGVTRRADGALARRAAAYLRAAAPHPPPVVAVSAPPPPPRVLARLAAIPLVESGLRTSDAAYLELKESSALMSWCASLGERSLSAGAALCGPALALCAPTVRRLDAALCASLDALERRLPSIMLPPEAMYSSSRQFVVRRADSVKQLGSAVLESRVSAATAGALSRALAAADKYVDKYLPGEERDAPDAAEPHAAPTPAAAAVQRGALLSRKLTRRLTRQALAEAKALREQIHVLAYVAELVLTDPARAWREARLLYAALSGPEPENQARPATLEELLVLVAREAARRLVHLLNYAHSDLPRNVTALAEAVEAALAVPVKVALAEVDGLRSRLLRLAARLQHAAGGWLEALALLLAGNEEREKLPQPPRDITQHNGLD